MRADAFRAHLAHRLTSGSATSYVAYARRVEAELGVDLDRCALDDPSVDWLLDRLKAAGVVAKSVANCRSALRAYARFRTEPC